MTAPPIERPVTAPQLRYLNDLAEEFGRFQDFWNVDDHRVAPVVQTQLAAGWPYEDRDSASAKIDDLKPRVQRLRKSQSPTTAPPVADVPAGRYALRNAPRFKNTITFFEVSRPTEGRWAGRTFLSIMQSDERVPVRDPQQRAMILGLIARDTQAAMILFGKESEHCGFCGRRLTNDESRDRGIGPICAGKLGW